MILSNNESGEDFQRLLQYLSLKVARTVSVEVEEINIVRIISLSSVERHNWGPGQLQLPVSSNAFPN